MIKLMNKTFYNESEEKEKLCEFIKNADILSMGSKCKQFEEEFSKLQGRKYSVFVNSGSSANLILIQSLLNRGLLKKGDNVGFSALTWSTNVMPLFQLGLNPIPIDVSLENLNVNSKNLLEMGEPIKALFITNLLGFCGDLDKIKEICEEKGIILIEDNCESLGSEFDGKKLGNFGLASSFSFFVGHHLSTIEGGMVCTCDEELYKTLLTTRAHGWDRNLEDVSKEELKQKHNISDFHARYSFYSIGFNLRPTEISGFIGLGQLKYMDYIHKKRNENYLRYEEVVKENPDFAPLNLSHMGFISNFAYPLIFKDKETFEKYRKRFYEKVEIRPLLGGCIPLQPFFPKGFPCYPNAKKAHELGFYLPNNPDLTEEEIKTITELLSSEKH